jgi:hypothetical protein
MTAEEHNKALVMDAFDAKFNQRDDTASIDTGRPPTSSTAPPRARPEGSLDRVKASPPDMLYEH